MEHDALFLDTASQPSARVHPSVLFTILDHHSRRRESQTRVIGTLVGGAVDGVVELRAAFPVPHSEDADTVAVDMDHARTMFELHNRVSPRDRVVGWYATGSGVTDHSELIQQFFSSEAARPLHLQVDTTLAHGRLSVAAFSCAQECLVRPLGPHFDQVPLEIVSQGPDRAALAALVDAVALELAPTTLGRVFSSSSSSSSGNKDSSSGNKNSTSGNKDSSSGNKDSSSGNKDTGGEGKKGSLVGKGGGKFPGELDQLESALVRVRERLSAVRAYAEAARMGAAEGDAGLGRELAFAVSEVPRVDPAEFEAALSSGTQDLLMVVYLSDLIKTQLGITEKLEKLI